MHGIVRQIIQPVLLQPLDQLSHEPQPAALLLLPHPHQRRGGGRDSWFEMCEELDPNVCVPHPA